MKKVLSIFLAASLIMPLCACSKSNTEKSPQASIEVADETATTSPEQSPQELIESAMQVYGWFEMVPLKVNYEDKKQVDGIDLYKIEDERYNTHEKLDSYLKTIFSSDIVDKLWAENIYKDIDGYLYCADGGRGGNIFIEDVKYDVSQKSDKKIVYNATVTYSKDSGEPENPKIFEFVREKVNDNWVFTSFPYFW